MTVADLRGEDTRESAGRTLPTPAARLGSPTGLALVYLLALAAAEALTALVEPRTGLVLHALLLVTLLVHTARNWSRRTRDLLLCLGFAPLIRLLSLSMPLAGFPLIYWYLIISVPLFVATVLAARTLGFTWGSLGVSLRGFPIQVLVGLTGLGFGYVEYLILKPEPLAEALTWDQLWLPVLVLLVSTGFAEELIFRGVMQRAAAGVLGQLDVPYVSAVFAVLHIGYLSLLDVLFVFWVALFFGWVVARTGSLVGVTLSHGLTNIALFLIVPFLLAAPSPPPQPVLSAPPALAPLVSTFTPSPRETPPPLTASPESLVPAVGSPAGPAATPGNMPLPSPPAGPLVHVVQPGENLYQIGLSYGVSWQALAGANGLIDARHLQAGQALVIPTPDPGQPSIPEAPPPLPTTHRVRPGENLYRIGLLYGVPWQELAAVNHLASADTVYAGQILVIQHYVPPPLPTIGEAETQPTPEPTSTTTPTTPPTSPPAEPSPPPR
jgi:membrane protease YdiL (CAAX protease family)/LysM repeat protein